MLEKNEKHGLLFYMKELTLVIVLFVLLLLFYCFAPKFMTIENIKNILVQNAYIIVSSIGMAFVIIGGGIDLSVGYQISLVGVITTISIQWFHLPVWCSVLIGLMIGTLLGAINGFLSVKLQVHPMVITLATMAIYQGISYIITNSNSIYGLPDSFKFIGQGKILGIPVSIIITVIVLIGATFFLSKTYPGRYIYALGGNGEAARLSGVNTSAMRVISFAICGFLCSSGIYFAGVQKWIYELISRCRNRVYLYYSSSARRSKHGRWGRKSLESVRRSHYFRCIV